MNNINKGVILYYFKKCTNRKNTIFHLYNEKKINKSIHLKYNNINRINKNSKNYEKLIESNILKKQLTSKYYKKDLLHNISNSTSIKNYHNQKEIQVLTVKNKVDQLLQLIFLI